MITKRNILIALGVIIIIGGLSWAYMESVKPAPGIEELQSERTHIPEGSKTNYNFNPPTSGAHYPSWITKGVYNTPRIDGNLVHSLEHGYIIFSYDCTKKLQASTVHSPQFTVHSLITPIFAQTSTDSGNLSPQQPIQMTQPGEGSPSARLEDMPKAFSDGSCQPLKDQLTALYNQFGTHKLIVVPRPGMDHPLALTAWGKVLKLNQIDKNQIKKFIDFYRDRGPEATNEP